MKTAISIPDDVFEQAEKVAKQLGMTRSELYTRAVRAYLETRTARNVTASYDAAFSDGAADDIDDFRRQATRRALRDVEWEEP